jgi:UDP-N-acetylglucosamine--N-acetylmuramyl-(pentapeptide) pyrophosphoryl-undecaprenol N-acetylglucosamine transferase
MTKRILIMAGGTGGHVFPGLAVADDLVNDSWQVHWLGTAERMEAQIVPKAGYDISFIDVAGVRGNGITRLLAAPYRIVKSIVQALRVIKTFNPDVVLGMGGFASGPGGIAAWLKRVPLVLHEQNAAAGLTNKILARFANVALEAFKGTFGAGKATHVGNPIRQAFLTAPEPSKRINCEHKLNILVVGGSLGALALNQALPKAVEALSNRELINVRHQAGKGKAEQVIAAYQQIGFSAEVSEFIDDIATAYQQADLVICRAGALTVSEIAAIGVGAVFVPLPHAVDDHQTKNAQVLVNAGAAKLMPQSLLQQGKLAELLNELITDRHQLLNMANAAKTVAVLDATKRVANECRRLAGSENK